MFIKKEEKKNYLCVFSLYPKINFFSQKREII